MGTRRMGRMGVVGWGWWEGHMRWRTRVGVGGWENEMGLHFVAGFGILDIIMKKMSVQEIQEVGLDVLRHIDGFCKEHRISYFLDSGTLLGAARHGGFIPWDDDVDILVPRPDYDRFVREYQDSERYKLYAPTRHNCFLSYARLCEMQRTFFQQENAWTREAPGVGVDIFPLDGAPDSREEYDNVLAKLRNLQTDVFALRARRTQWRKFRKTPAGFLKDCLHFAAFLFRRCLRGRFIRKKLAEIDRLRRKWPYETATLCGYAVLQGKVKYLPKAWFAKSLEMEFCGEKFPVPVGYDERLTAEYGDWRTPIPESERGGHSGLQSMWWRD